MCHRSISARRVPTADHDKLCGARHRADKTCEKNYGIGFSIASGLFTAVGFLIAIVILAGIREKMEYNDIPESFQGMPIVLITAGLMAIAFCGFSGLL